MFQCIFFFYHLVIFIKDGLCHISHRVCHRRKIIVLVISVGSCPFTWLRHSCDITNRVIGEFCQISQWVRYLYHTPCQVVLVLAASAKRVCLFCQISQFIIRILRETFQWICNCKHMMQLIVGIAGTAFQAITFFDDIICFIVCKVFLISQRACHTLKPPCYIIGIFICSSVCLGHLRDISI